MIGIATKDKRFFHAVRTCCTFAAILLFIVLLSCFSRSLAAGEVASGTCGAQGDNVRWSLRSDGELVISGSGAMEDYDDRFLEDLAPWFSTHDFGRIKKVVIENGVTTIGDASFINCYNLYSVTIPSSVITIGDYAFGNWDYSKSYKLTSVQIPNGVTSIGTCAFRGSNGLTSVTISASVKSIGGFAFGKCSNLSAINVHADNRYYSSDQTGCLFDKKKTLLIQYPIGNQRTTYSIPNGVKTIGTDAFDFCENLTSVIIPNSVTTIEREAFWGCEALSSIAIPIGVTSIGDRVFSDCSKLSRISVDSRNGKYASDETGCLFNKNKATLIQYPIGNSRTEFIIPGSVKRIESQAFLGSDRLFDVSILSNVTEIGAEAFGACDNLRTIRVLNPKCLIGNDAIPTTATLYGYQSSTAQTYAQENSMCFSEIVHTHTYGAVVIEQEATCARTGRQYQICTECGQKGNEKAVAKTAHTYKTKTVAATIAADGKMYEQCSVCSATGKTVIIPKVSTVKLSKTVYVFTGKVKKPKVVVRDREGKTLEADKDYRVKYASGRTACGVYSVSVVLKGKYTGKKTLSFKITPEKVTGLKQTSGKGIRFSWNAVDGATVYDVEYYDKQKGKYLPLPSKKYPNGYTVTQAKGSLKRGTEMQARVRAVYITKDGERIAGKYSKTLIMTAK